MITKEINLIIDLAPATGENVESKPYPFTCEFIIPLAIHQHPPTHVESPIRTLTFDIV